MDSLHVPVLANEAIAALQLQPAGRYIDGTLGDGGHSQAILSVENLGAVVLGIDLDSEAITRARKRLVGSANRFIAVHGSYADIEEIAMPNGFSPASAILLDLGISSYQVDSGDRGFSFLRESRLDMRFDSGQALSAFEVVNEYSEGALIEMLRKLGEERRAVRIARAIIRGRPVGSTTELAGIVAQAIGGRAGRRIHPATRTFQAIRMEVNDEIGNVAKGVRGSISTLGQGGRLVVISYHSVEDRVVKNLFRTESASCVCPPGLPQCVCDHTPTVRIINRRVIKPTEDEVHANPRSRSARMRVVERL